MKNTKHHDKWAKFCRSEAGQAAASFNYEDEPVTGSSSGSSSGKRKYSSGSSSGKRKHSSAPSPPNVTSPENRFKKICKELFTFVSEHEPQFPDVLALDLATCDKIEDRKGYYKELIMKYHPDKNEKQNEKDATKIFQKMKNLEDTIK